MDFNKVLFTGPTLNSFMCFVIIMFLFIYKITSRQFEILHQNNVLFLVGRIV